MKAVLEAPTIYYKPHKGRNKEAEFFNTLKTHFSGATIINRNYALPSECIEYLVDTNILVTWLEADTLLPSERRKKCMRVLNDCSAQLKVGLSASRISFDIVVVQNGRPYYWEFHEEQHRELTDGRESKLFISDNSPVIVQRYLQRLVRDVWRTQYFHPYTIVWSDWFTDNQTTYRPQLSDDFREFGKRSKFSFEAFCQM
jgi:hypothetical protein